MKKIESRILDKEIQNYENESFLVAVIVFFFNFIKLPIFLYYAFLLYFDEKSKIKSDIKEMSWSYYILFLDMIPSQWHQRKINKNMKKMGFATLPILKKEEKFSHGNLTIQYNGNGELTSLYYLLSAVKIHFEKKFEHYYKCTFMNVTNNTTETFYFDINELLFSEEFRELVSLYREAHNEFVKQYKVVHAPRTEEMSGLMEKVETENVILKSGTKEALSEQQLASLSLLLKEKREQEEIKKRLEKKS